MIEIHILCVLHTSLVGEALPQAAVGRSLTRLSWRHNEWIVSSFNK